MVKDLKEVLLDDFWIMPATPKYINNGVPYITSKNIKNERIDFSNVNYISIEDYERISKNRPILIDDILISMIGTLGEVAVVKKSDGVFYGQNMFLVRLNKDKIYQRYFINYFKSNIVKRQLMRKQNKSTQSYLKANHIESLKIPIPDIAEQKKIANKLDKVQEIINMRKKQIDGLDELIKSEFVERFENKKYEKLSGKKLFSFSSGKFLEASKRLENGVPVYGGNGVAWYTDEPLIGFNTIVIGRVGAYCGNVKLIKEPVWITDNAIFIKQFKKDLYNIDFLYYMMELVDFSRFAQFSGQPKITQKPLEEFNYVVPPIELQNHFADIVKQVDKQKFEIQKSLEETQKLQDSLMNKYFG